MLDCPDDFHSENRSFSALKKQVTDGRTIQPTNGRINQRTRPHIEMRGRIKKGKCHRPADRGPTTLKYVDTPFQRRHLCRHFNTYVWHYGIYIDVLDCIRQDEDMIANFQSVLWSSSFSPDEPIENLRSYFYLVLCRPIHRLCLNYKSQTSNDTTIFKIY